MPAKIHSEIPMMAAEQDTVLRGQTRNKEAMVLSCVWETATHALRSTSQEGDGQDAGEGTGHVDITRACGNPSGQSNLCLSLAILDGIEMYPKFRSVLT